MPPDPRRDGRSEPRRDGGRAPARRPGPPARPRRRFPTPGRAALSLFIALVVAVTASVAHPVMTPLTTGGLAVALGCAPLLVDLPRELRAARAGGAGLVPAVLATAALLGVGGCLAYGTTVAVDRVTAQEAVLGERLVAPAAGGVGPLVATVERVSVTEHFTKVTLSAVNRSALAAKVGVVDSCRLVGEDGAELRLDGLFEAARERFFLEVPGGGAVVRVTVAFPGALARGETAAALGCGSVSWSGSDPVWRTGDVVGRALRVPDIRLAAVR
ncbi:hypothetical protein [Saccharothrix algeriensis]|uniref:Uncharacterized protein n=2 Tax=Saccharothrix algeriensis TaxID=173560 RepID=A0ABS2SGM9_9PSEU|nr:hypothetical protein [Saccharothrix algeriensis]MBM7814226.1 hypothetical protein [Saccharothrix algeriensis]